MPLFFFLSGLTARAWHEGFSRKFFKSLKSLAVPYFFFSVVSIFLWQMVNGNLLSVASWGNLAGQMAYGVAGLEQKMSYDAPLWFFTCLFSVRLLFGSITAFSNGPTMTMVASCLIALFAHVIVFTHFRSMLWNFDVALVSLLFYCAGFVISRTYLSMSPSSPLSKGPASVLWLLLSVALVLAAALINGRVDMNGRAFGNAWVFYAGAFAGIYAAIALSATLSKFSWTAALGQASIAIFPLHTLWPLLPYRIMPTIKWYGFRLTHSDLGGALLVALVEILLCLPFYFALRRWAPQLIGMTHLKPTASVHQYTNPAVSH